MRRDPAAHLLILLSLLNLGASSESLGTNFVPVPRAKLCVTEGEIDALPGPRLSIDIRKMRAYLNETIPQAIQAHFTYLGQTANPSPSAPAQFARSSVSSCMRRTPAISSTRCGASSPSRNWSFLSRAIPVSTPALNAPITDIRTSNRREAGRPPSCIRARRTGFAPR